jgi:hypothetical protein
MGMSLFNVKIEIDEVGTLSALPGTHSPVW